MDPIKEWWASFLSPCSLLLFYATKLMLLNGKLKDWNIDTFGHLQIRKSSILDDIYHLEEESESRDFNRGRINAKSRNANGTGRHC